MTRAAAAGLLASLLAGCAVFGGGSEDPRVVYPVNETQADQILRDALGEELGFEALHRLSLSPPGYRVEVGNHAILAVRIPAVGRTESGQEVGGFVFQVRRRGTPPDDRVRAVTRRILENGSEAALALPLVRTLE